jgi:hypothetical protein
MSEFDPEVTLREITKENLWDILRLKVAPLTLPENSKV